MKKLWIILLLPAFIMACQSKSGKKPQPVKEEISISTDIQEVQLNVTGMTCEGCERAVETCVKELDGIVEVKANHEQSKVTVRVNKEKYNRDSIRQKIEAIGYSVVE